MITHGEVTAVLATAEVLNVYLSGSPKIRPFCLEAFNQFSESAKQNGQDYLQTEDTSVVADLFTSGFLKALDLKLHLLNVLRYFNKLSNLIGC